jgi:hypothetical protein
MTGIPHGVPDSPDQSNEDTKMPCDSIRTYGLKLEHMDRSILHDALKNSERFRVLNVRPDQSIILHDTKTRSEVEIQADGQTRVSASYLTQEQTDDIGNSIRQTYSREVVMTQARKFGWLIQEKEPNQFTIVRR